MIKKFPLSLVLSFAVWISLSTLCRAGDLSIVISLNPNSPLKQSIANDPSRLVVSTKIINTSGKDQKISIWTCSYGWDWVAAVPVVVTGIESCRENVQGNILLKPHEAYSRDIVIAISSKAKEGLLALVLGFNPQGDWFGTKRGIDQRVESLKGIVWSNTLDISVTPQMLSSAWKISDELEKKSIMDFHRHWAGYEWREQTAPAVWRKCSSDGDCDAWEVGCWFWAVANKKFSREVRDNVGSQACTKSVPAGPKPVTACIQGVCADKWKACGQDEDCAVAYTGGLRWKAVNKKYLNESQAAQCRYEEELWKLPCSHARPVDMTGPVAACENKACQLYW